MIPSQRECIRWSRRADSRDVANAPKHVVRARILLRLCGVTRVGVHASRDGVFRPEASSTSNSTRAKIALKPPAK
jgi:hypothetical protein